MKRNRQRVLVALTVLLAVLAIVLVAAAVVPTETDDGGAGDGTGLQPFGQQSGDAQDFEITIDVPPLLRNVVLALFIGITIVEIFVRVSTLTPKWTLYTLLAAGFVFGLLYVNPSFSFPQPEGRPQPATNGSGPAGSGALNPAVPGTDIPIVAIGGLVVVLAGVVALFVLSGGRSEPPEAEHVDEQEPVDDLEAVGSAAGRAASQLQAGVDSMNAIYRAWVEMTEALSVSDPDTTTPGEFAEAAIQAGMAPDDVRELTRLFEDVRYGDAPPSSDRVDRAEQALRRIEATYGDDEVTEQRGETDGTDSLEDAQ